MFHRAIHERLAYNNQPCKYRLRTLNSISARIRISPYTGQFVHRRVLVFDRSINITGETAAYRPCFQPVTLAMRSRRGKKIPKGASRGSLECSAFQGTPFESSRENVSSFSSFLTRLPTRSNYLPPAKEIKGRGGDEGAGGDLG